MKFPFHGNAKTVNTIHQGDAIQVTKQLVKQGVKVNSTITSSPYYQARNYGCDGQLGLEPSYKDYLGKLWELADALWELLYDHGTVYFNLGDIVNGEKQGNTNGLYHGTARQKQGINEMAINKTHQEGIPRKSYLMIPEQFALGMIQRGWILRSKIIWRKFNVRPESALDRYTLDWEYIFFFAKSNAPLYWTNTRHFNMQWQSPPGTQGLEDVDWFWKEVKTPKLLAKVLEYVKENGVIPENFKTTTDVKTGKLVYWRKWTLWKSHDYYFDTRYRPYADSTLKEFEDGYNGKNLKDYTGTGAQGGSDLKNNILAKRRKILFGGDKANGYGNDVYSGDDWEASAKGAIMRCVWDYNEHMLVEAIVEGDFAQASVWDVNTHGFKESHFAVFPQELVEIPLKASVPEFVCPVCNWMSHTIYDEDRINTRPGFDVNTGKCGTEQDPNKGFHVSDWSKYKPKIKRQPAGYKFCEHNPLNFTPGIVYDPFMGSGTTALAALANGRNFIGCELNEDYIQIAERRLASLRNDRIV